MPSESDQKIAKEMSLILVFQFDILKVNKWAYDEKQPTANFLPTSNEGLMRHIEKRAQNLRNRCMRETLTLFYKPENRAKIEKCAGRLLRQRERVVLSREDLNNVFVSRVSTDERWNSPPVRTSPNFGHFSILEKNWGREGKKAYTHFQRRTTVIWPPFWPTFNLFLHTMFSANRSALISMR
ncbi:hypothetical protein niasHT_013099 [Heterodera trifolii]|uniref:Uncharacterized protein n=1 Tax=Heterodera trifolii TaxID=157864 RepID=A0ABD2L755_9BILA